MECPDRELIFAYAHRMLAPGEEAEVCRHLETCAACREAANEYSRLDSVLDEWKPSEPSPAFDSRVRWALVNSEARALIGRGWVPALVPAMILLVILVGVLAIRNHGAKPTASAVPAVATTATQPAAPAALETPDQQAESELTMYQNLSLLEDYDMLREFDVLSEMPKGGKRVEN